MIARVQRAAWWCGSALLVLTVAAGVIRPPRARALTFTVDDTSDLADAIIGDDRCETDAGTCSLRAAIQESNASDDADEIVLEAELYSLTLFDVEENAALSGDLDITDSVTIRGASAETTIINAGRIDRVFDVDPEDVGDITVEISAVAIQGGSASGGGGIANRASLVLRAVAITDNTGLDDGGGIDNLGSLSIADSLIAGNNSRENGAGVVNHGVLTVVNTTVSGNEAVGNGGGIANDGTLTLTSSTVADNQGAAGGGIANSGTAMVGGSIVADNRGGNCDSTLTSTGYNLESADTCGFSAQTDVRGSDPQLCPLDDYGGPTVTHALPASSAALDAGPATGCPATDQRGTTRPRDGDGDGTPMCDIGAFELADDDTSCGAATPTPTPTRGSPTATPTLPAGTCTGDCDGNTEVTVNELVRGVRIVLGSSPISECRAFDRNDSGTVTIDELVAAVNGLLTGCE